MSLCQHQLRYNNMRRDFQAFRSLSCLLDISAFSSIFCYSYVTRQLFSVYNYLQHSLQCVKNGRLSAQLRKTSQLPVSRHLRLLHRNSSSLTWSVCFDDTYRSGGCYVFLYRHHCAHQKPPHLWSHPCAVIAFDFHLPFLRVSHYSILAVPLFLLSN